MLYSTQSKIYDFLGLNKIKPCNVVPIPDIYLEHLYVDLTHKIALSREHLMIYIFESLIVPGGTSPRYNTFRDQICMILNEVLNKQKICEDMFYSLIQFVMIIMNYSIYSSSIKYVDQKYKNIYVNNECRYELKFKNQNNEYIVSMNDFTTSILEFYKAFVSKHNDKITDKRNTTLFKAFLVEDEEQFLLGNEFERNLNININLNKWDSSASTDRIYVDYNLNLLDKNYSYVHNNKKISYSAFGTFGRNSNLKPHIPRMQSKEKERFNAYMTDHFSFDKSNYTSNGSNSKEKLLLTGSNSKEKLILNGSNSKEKLFETGSFQQPSLTHIISVANINFITREIQTDYSQLKIQYEYKNETLKSYLDKKLSLDSYMINNDSQCHNKFITHHKGQSLMPVYIKNTYDNRKKVKFSNECTNNLKDDTLNYLYPHIHNSPNTNNDNKMKYINKPLDKLYGNIDLYESKDIIKKSIITEHSSIGHVKSGIYSELEIGDWFGSSIGADQKGSVRGEYIRGNHKKYTDYDPLESILNETIKYNIYPYEYCIQKVIKKPVYKYVNKSNIPVYSINMNKTNNNQQYGDQFVDSYSGIANDTLKYSWSYGRDFESTFSNNETNNPNLNYNNTIFNRTKSKNYIGEIYMYAHESIDRYKKDKEIMCNRTQKYYLNYDILSKKNSENINIKNNINDRFSFNNNFKESNKLTINLNNSNVTYTNENSIKVWFKNLIKICKN